MDNVIIPMVSVCMITYNHEKFIQEAIEGVLMQETAFEYELIISNDCSTDQTHTLIKNLIQSHPKGYLIRYFNHETNLGMMPNAIFTLEKCRGKYIANCEGDDYWTDPSKLQKQVDFLEVNEDFSICYHDVMVKKENKLVNDFITIPLASTTDINDLIQKANYIHTPSVVFRNKLRKYPLQFKLTPVGDYFLYILLTEDNSKIKRLYEKMAVYRYGVGVHSKDSLINRTWKWYETLFLIKSHLSEDKGEILKIRMEEVKRKIEWLIINDCSKEKVSFKFNFFDLIKLLVKKLLKPFRIDENLN